MPKRRNKHIKSYDEVFNFKGAIVRHRGKSYQAEINYGNKRIRKTEKTIDEIKTWIGVKQNEITNAGVSSFRLSEKQRIDAAEAVNLLGDSTSLTEAAMFWIKHHKPVVGAMSMPELLDLYIANKKKLNRRPATIQELQLELGKFVRNHNKPASHITMMDLDKWLDESTRTPVRRNKVKRLLHGFFSFARKQGLIALNPAAELENAAVDEKATEIYALAEVERMLDAAKSDALYSKTVPYYAIGLFAGLRPSEIQSLDWRLIDFEGKLIKVLSETAKRRRNRYVRMSDNLIEWLLPFRMDSGKVAPLYPTILRSRDKILETAKIGKWIPDGMRHTFGSMHLAAYQDAAKTAAEMGQIGTAVLYQHYRELVKPDDAKRFWEIMPKAIDVTQ